MQLFEKYSSLVTMTVEDFPARLWIRRVLRKIFWNAPRIMIPILIQLRFRKKFINRVKLARTGALLKLTEFRDSGEVKDCIHLYHPLRTTRYFDGITHRIEKLLEEYCVNQIHDLNSGVFVDIGSNIGEFSLGISRKYPDSKFIRFEPSYEENLASKVNMSNCADILIPKALWSKKAELKFYQRNEQGDSSLFSPDNEDNWINIQTSTLDDEISEIFSGVIELLKLEAEGAEPEILLGGEKILKRCRYVTADLGPERGIQQESTFNAASMILKNYGFSLIGRNPGSRMCFLFRNNNFS